MRVPLIVRWPGRIKPGTVSDHLGYFPDVMPTLAELAGATAHLPPTDGISLGPTLLGRPGQKLHPFLYWEAASVNQTVSQQAVRWGQWKAVRSRGTGEFELYDLKTDGKESTNVTAKHPDVVARIKTFVATARTPERVYDVAAKESAANYVR